MRRSTLLTGLFFIFSASNLPADVFYKHDGGKVVGELIASESNAEEVTIKTRFGKIKLKRSQIKSIEEDSDSPPAGAAATSKGEKASASEEKPGEKSRPATASGVKAAEYEKAKAEFKDTAADQFALAIWCQENGRPSDYRKHLERVIALEPNHEEARRRLGYRLHEGKWLTYDEAKLAQGYVKYGARWVLPQEKELFEKLDREKEKVKFYFKTVRAALSRMRSGNPSQAEAGLSDLMAIEDPYAISALLENMLSVKEKNPSPASRKSAYPTIEEQVLLPKILAQIPGDEATTALVKIAIESEQSEARWSAVDALKPRKTVGLLTQITRYLKDDENEKVANAAKALGEIGDQTVVPALVDALVTKHTKVVKLTFSEVAKQQLAAANPQIKATETYIGPDGNLRRKINVVNQTQGVGGTMVGPSPQDHYSQTEHIQNPDVVQALFKLTGKNFGYNKEDWLEWIRKEFKAEGKK